MKDGEFQARQILENKGIMLEPYDDNSKMGMPDFRYRDVKNRYLEITHTHHDFAKETLMENSVQLEAKMLMFELAESISAKEKSCYYLQSEHTDEWRRDKKILTAISKYIADSSHSIDKITERILVKDEKYSERRYPVDLFIFCSDVEYNLLGNALLASEKDNTGLTFDAERFLMVVNNSCFFRIYVCAFDLIELAYETVNPACMVFTKGKRLVCETLDKFSEKFKKGGCDLC